MKSADRNNCRKCLARQWSDSLIRNTWLRMVCLRGYSAYITMLPPKFLSNSQSADLIIALSSWTTPFSQEAIELFLFNMPRVLIHISNVLSVIHFVNFQNTVEHQISMQPNVNLCYCISTGCAFEMDMYIFHHIFIIFERFWFVNIRYKGVLNQSDIIC